jgi:RHS repeat-associated protein
MISVLRHFLAALLTFALIPPFPAEAAPTVSSRVTDTYDYDAFGNLIHSTGTTPNNYLFAGEQFDPELGLYYNRARYRNVSTGGWRTPNATKKPSRVAYPLRFFRKGWAVLRRFGTRRDDALSASHPSVSFHSNDNPPVKYLDNITDPCYRAVC